VIASCGILPQCTTLRGDIVSVRDVVVRRGVQARPWLMAAACSDRFVRVYDVRKLSLRAPGAAAASPPLLALAPLHLCTAPGIGDAMGRPYTTCARFSNRGDQLVATYHGEQARALAYFHRNGVSSKAHVPL
jgi:hypothetical protein